MALEIDFEAAARKLCAIRHIAPDTMVNYSVKGHDVPMQRPAWRNVEDEVRAHFEVQNAINTSWVMKQQAGAPVAEEEVSYV